MIKKIRQLHLHLGLFFVPAIIFFAVSGAFQTFGLHETHPGNAFQTPTWLKLMAQIHTNQSMQLIKRPQQAGPAADGNVPVKSATEEKALNAGKEKTTRPKIHKSWPFKWFVLGLALGLITNALSGIYMAFSYNRDRKIVVGLLCAGITVPVAFLFM